MDDIEGNLLRVATRMASLRDQLELMRAEFRALLKQYANNGAAHGVAERVLELLASQPAKKWDAMEIAKALNESNVRRVRATLHRLVHSGKIAKAGRGKFRSKQ